MSTTIPAIANSNASLDNTATSTYSNTIDIDGFYQLFAAQLQYQDPDNPMETSEMMNMMTQTQMIEAMTLMTGAISQMSQTNAITYAASMIGQTVSVAEYDDSTGMYTGENITGVVTGVLMGEQPIIYVNGEPYLLAQIMTIGETETTTDGSTGDESTESTNPEDEVIEHGTA